MGANELRQIIQRPWDRPLAPAMQIFADEWLTGAHTGKRFNARAAAEYAGYSTGGANPYQRGNHLLRHPGVKAYIKQYFEYHTMQAQEVLMRFTEIARAEVGTTVVKDAHGRLTLDPDKVIENKRFIKSFGLDSNGNPKIEFHDSHAALRDIARVLGMLKDGLEISGPGGGAVPVNMTVQFVKPGGETVNQVPAIPEETIDEAEWEPILPDDDAA